MDPKRNQTCVFTPFLLKFQKERKPNQIQMIYGFDSGLCGGYKSQLDEVILVTNQPTFLFLEPNVTQCTCKEGIWVCSSVTVVVALHLGVDQLYQTLYIRWSDMWIPFLIEVYVPDKKKPFINIQIFFIVYEQNVRWFFTCSRFRQTAWLVRCYLGLH